MIIFDRLNCVFQDVFDDDELLIERNYTARDIEDWDSLMHVNLVLAVEKEFAIRLSSYEVTRLKNVGDFIDLIEARL
ncbi:MAG: acyl carrier protein [Gammaproteobacteria bacterium]|nr:acyl carrier protein [Gammaproteobacteria bacterium]